MINSCNCYPFPVLSKAKFPLLPVPTVTTAQKLSAVYSSLPKKSLLTSLKGYFFSFYRLSSPFLHYLSPLSKDKRKIHLLLFKCFTQFRPLPKGYLWNNHLSQSQIYFTAWLPREIHLFKSSIISEKHCLKYPDSNIILIQIQVEIDRENEKNI